jgi:putative oxidoreductase
MKKATILTVIPRLLLGILATYGGVLHFTMDVAVWKNSFLSSLYQTGYLWQIIGVINFVAGVFLIINRFSILSLLILLPITFNIFLYHIFFFTPDGLFIGIPMFVLNTVCIWQYRSYFKQLTQIKITK